MFFTYITEVHMATTTVVHNNMCCVLFVCTSLIYMFAGKTKFQK